MMELMIKLDDELVEKLSALEHDQWSAWATSLSLSEKLSAKRIKRWHESMIPYDELSNEVQEYDRVWARKVISVLKEHSGSKDESHEGKGKR